MYISFFRFHPVSMLDLHQLFRSVPSPRFAGYDLGPEPSTSEMNEVVDELKAEGLCGRRIAEEHLAPYLIASPEYGQRELDILEELVEEAFADTDRCVRTRSRECSRLRGGCQSR